MIIGTTNIVLQVPISKYRTRNGRRAHECHSEPNAFDDRFGVFVAALGNGVDTMGPSIGPDLVEYIDLRVFS